jgi:transposase
MGNGTGISRGDRNRNDRLIGLRGLVPATNAIVGIDLADRKQAAVVVDHDSRVLARRRVTCRPWELGEVLDWAVRQAKAAGFASVTVACEPTGHRWRVLDQLAAERGLGLVCVQPLLVWRAREAEDLTWDKSDPKDAVLIARLAGQLRCYVPERIDQDWATLRHLGARRAKLITQASAQIQQVRDLLECVWPAALETCASPFRSKSWSAAMAVVLNRCGGDLTRVRRLGLTRFTRAVRRELPAWGTRRPCMRIITAVFTALSDPVGVHAHRPGGLERAKLVFADWAQTRRRLAEVEDRMSAVLEQLGLTALVTSIDGLSAVGAAAILAETGDLTRFRSPRAVVKHAGLCPRDNASGAYQGKSTLSGRGRPALRLAAWRAVWAALPNNSVLAARFEHLTTREDNRLAPQQARAACAASLLRWLHAVVTTGVTWDAQIAAGHRSTPMAA